jgi:mannose-1-phosphate guanylyltransferase
MSPSTQYGYLDYSPKEYAHGCYAVTKFHEKPSLETAQLYQHNSHMLWNSGIFCARISFFLELYQTHAPELYKQVSNYLQGTGSYEDISAISFDCAVVEKTNSCAVLPAHFTWSDVGTIEQFLSFKNTQPQEQVVAYRSSNNTVSGTKKVVALFSVHDLCIIETDDILYIAAKSELEQVREFIEFLKTNGHNQFL